MPNTVFLFSDQTSESFATEAEARERAFVLFREDAEGEPEENHDENGVVLLGEERECLVAFGPTAALRECLREDHGIDDPGF
jgi:hypothetical protein